MSGADDVLKVLLLPVADVESLPGGPEVVPQPGGVLAGPPELQVETAQSCPLHSRLRQSRLDRDRTELPQPSQKEPPEPEVARPPASAPDKSVQHAGQPPKGQTDVGCQGRDQPLPGVVAPVEKSSLSDPAECEEPPGEHKAQNQFNSTQHYL